MTALEQLKAILKETYRSEDGAEYMVELRPGLTEQRIDQLAASLPTGTIPSEVRQLLHFSSGFSFYGLDDITIDGIQEFGFENIFPNSVQLAGDGFGNFWILDVDASGSWNSVFFVCHDPAVVVLHSGSLTEFIKHIDEYGKMGRNSNLGIIHEETVMDIWQNDPGFTNINEALQSPDRVLSAFAAELPTHFVIADLRGKPNKSGFAWGKFGPKIENAVRHKTELLWGFESRGRQQKSPTQKKKGFFSRLLGRP
jgi:hypothetical protein